MIAVCIGCGCTDERACLGGCFWLRVDYACGIGVCSNCEDHEGRWDSGDRTPWPTMPKIEDDDSAFLLPGDDDYEATLDLLP